MMAAPLRIAFIGKMASGKSHASSLLTALRPDVAELSFATPIKAIASTHFGMGKQDKDRRLLQVIGNTGRIIQPRVWIDALVQRLEPLKSYVVTDARFKNEVEALKSCGFRVVYLNVDQQTRVNRLRRVYKDDAVRHIQNMNDVSEVQLCPADGDDVWSNTDQEELMRRIQALV